MFQGLHFVNLFTKPNDFGIIFLLLNYKLFLQTKEKVNFFH